MKLARTSLLIGVAVLAVCFALPAQAESIPVGSSSLIAGTPDYSDTFTNTDFGGLPDRDATWNPGASDYPPNGTPGEGLQMESCYLYGTPPPDRWWPDWQWTFAHDGNVLPTTGSPYPGNSGGGSDTGITQTGGGPGFGQDWGIEYGVRDEFIVQYDVVMTDDRVDIIIGDVLNTLFDNTNLCVFIRKSGSVGFPEVSLFNAATGEVATDLLSPILGPDQWYNVAARFDTVGREIEVFVDEVSLGVVSVDTVGGGAMAGVPMSNNVINIGGSHYLEDGDRIWTDNFQVGEYIPEPGTVVLLLSGLAVLIVALHRKKA